MNISFLGAGRLANALIKGFLNSGLVSPSEITVSSKSGTTALALATKYDIQAAPDNISSATASSIIFLCTKPAAALATLSALQPHLKNKLIISVAAGVSCARLFEAAGVDARIIRAMPNTAVRIRKGATSITAHSSATIEDLDFTMKLFSSVGFAFQISEEKKDAVTALSGSAPAFALLFLESLMQGGIEEGLDPTLAKTLAAHTLAAAAALVLETNDSPQHLRSEITSPNGMTAAGTAVLQEAKIADTVKAAIHAATKRAAELAL